MSVWNIDHDMVRETVTLTMPFEAAEFIWMELPPRDGFTRDWYALVWKPIIDAESDEVVTA